MHSTDDLLSTAEAAEYRGVHRSTITRWVQSGRLAVAHRTPGGFLLFRRGDIDALLETEGAA
jgi:excisionase family DNA binding protein